MDIEQIEFNTGAIDAGDCVSLAWGGIKEDYWFYFGVAVVAWLISITSAMIPVLSIVVAPIIGGPLFAGVFWVFLAKADGNKRDFAEMFAGFKKFRTTMTVGLVLSIPGVLLQIYQLVTTIRQFAIIFTEGVNSEILNQDPFPPLLIGLYAFLLVYSLTVGLLLYFSLFLIMDRDLGTKDSIILSARAIFGNLGGIILLLILQSLLAVAGILACGVGIFFIMPVLYLSSAVAYRKVFPGPAGGHQPVLTPPSPDLYSDLSGNSG